MTGRAGAVLAEADRRLIDRLQDGLPIVDRPFAAVGAELGLAEAEVLDRLRALLERGVLSRFGPLFDAARLGGALTLAALHAPEAEFERLADLVNRHAEVAHNYRRDHELNMWFVVATGEPGRLEAVIAEIAAETGQAVLNLPKLAEYRLDLRFKA
ncbi:MAG: Lrp/AsnC family transcriptional regulator [Rhodospirillaceae bacterium]